MRVLLFSNAITPDRHGGLQRYCRDLGSALSAKGADVTIHTRKIHDQDPMRCVDPDGVEILRFPTPSRQNPLYAIGYPATAMRAVRAAARTARGTRVLHSHFPLQGAPLALGRRPYVHTFHAPVYREVLPEHQDTYLLPGPARAAARQAVRACDSLAVRRASSLVVLSEFMRDEAVALGARPERMTLIPGGIDTALFAPGSRIEHPWIGEQRPVIFTARRMVPRTGVRELVEAFSLIARELPEVRLALAGRGPLEDEIRMRVDALGLAERVAMLGWITDEDLVGWYRAAELVIMPTQELEGFGLTTAEALACGTPVVATPVGANAEVLGALSEALITSDASPAAIAATASELLKDRARLHALASKARAAVHPKLAWSSVADGYMSIYERYTPHA